VSGPSHRRRRAPRSARFERAEPRLFLSARPVADFWFDDSLSADFASGALDQPAEVPALAEVEPALVDAHQLTGLTQARAEYGLTGEGQTVAVIDTGVAYTHAALGGGLGTGYRVVGGFDFSDERDLDPYDDGPSGAHGTHVAGIIASDDSSYPGVAPGVDLVALRVFNDEGQGTFRWVEEALRWVHNNRFAFENPVTTVNLSIGTEWNSDSLPAFAVLEDELAQLEADGIFVAVAAGNDFLSYNTPGLSYPAVSPHVVPVGSVDDNGAISYYSQRDVRMIAAPGRSVQSTVPDYVGNRNGADDDFGRFSGTSMASPYVAGAGVLLREAYAFAGVQDVDQQTLYDVMIATADAVYDAATGLTYHRLNLDAALDAVMPADDFGSTASTAHSLGTVVDTLSLSGTIGRLDDADFFQFTAGATGTVTFSVQTDGRLAPAWQWAAAGQPGGTQDGDELSLDVVAGRTYTVALASSDGLGHYTLDGKLEPDAAAIDLGTVWQGRFDGFAIRGDGQRFTVTAAADGILTIEALFAHARGDVDIDLYDAQGRLVGSCCGLGDLERIDVAARAGQTFELHVYVYGGGLNGQVDLRVTNLVARDGSVVTVLGTEGDDHFTFNAATRELAIGGVAYQFRSVVVDRVTFDGRGGADTAVLRGTSGADSAVLKPDAGSLSGAGYQADVENVESVTVRSGGGDDSVVFYDSAGDDTFFATARLAGMLGGGFSHYAEGFTKVEAYSISGGQDVAKLYDSAGDDTFVASPSQAHLFGQGFWNTVRYFDAVHAYATAGGTDVAKLFDSAGNDTFRATPTEAALYGTGFYNRAKFFEAVHGYSTVGGEDTAYLLDSAGDDRLMVRSLDTLMYGQGYFNRAKLFEHVFAGGAAGGTDLAALGGSPGSDQVAAQANSAEWLNELAALRLADFEQVPTRADSRGNDTARIAAVDYVLDLERQWDA